MTETEFINEFDLLYDAGSKGAPSIDDYEKSVYLTTAQEEIIKSFYSGRNPDQKAFEGNEKRRRALNELVKPYSQSTQTASNSGISADSVFYAIPEVFYIVWEECEYIVKGTQSTKRNLDIKPTTHDEYLKAVKSPFKRPNYRKAFRMDIAKEGANNLVEIVSDQDLSKYSMRYVEKPKPIIVTDIAAGDFVGMGLTIDGVTSVSQCLLNKEIHRDILNRAVELAIRDFRENTLQSKVQTNGRT